jgi:protein phosphatase PTC7
MIPHPDKAHRGGEDAFFASNHLLVIADGVGGWSSQGIDPANYSRFLCFA